MAHSKGVQVMVDGAHSFAHLQFYLLICIVIIMVPVCISG